LPAIEEDGEDSDEVVAEKESKTKVKPVSDLATWSRLHLEAELVVQVEKDQEGGER